MTATELAGEPITAKLTAAPGNGAPIGGLKVIAASGWFAARPSGTENIYKIYAESFRGESRAGGCVERSQEIVERVLCDFFLHGGDPMKATQMLHDLGQSLWLDNITRDLLDQRHAGALHRRALGHRTDVESDDFRSGDQEQLGLRRGDPQKAQRRARSGEDLFFDLALEDLTRAADLFRPICDRTNGVDGWVSLEVSPLLAYDTASTLAAAKDLFARAGGVPTCSSRFPARRKACPRSRRRSSPASRST